MDGAHQRRAVSEGSLFPTVTGNLRTEYSRRGGKGRGERERADKGRGGGPGDSLEERGLYVDVTWRKKGGLHQVMWVRVLWRDYKRESIVNVTK